MALVVDIVGSLAAMFGGLAALNLLKRQKNKNFHLFFSRGDLRPLSVTECDLS